MIRIRGVHKAYGGGPRPQPVLDGVDLEVPRGGFVAVVGPSGSGKSTLLNLVGGLDTDYQGRVEVAGRDLGALDDAALSRFRARTVGFVFQSFHLLTPLTALENVLVPTWFTPLEGGEPAQAARSALERVGLGDKTHRRPAELSGGERQRVAIARALLMRPPLLLCDEPTGNLDRRTGAEIVSLFEELHREGMTLLMVTHETRLSERAARVYHLEEGRLTAGQPGEGSR